MPDSVPPTINANLKPMRRRPARLAPARKHVRSGPFDVVAISPDRARSWSATKLPGIRMSHQRSRSNVTCTASWTFLTDRRSDGREPTWGIRSLTD